MKRMTQEDFNEWVNLKNGEFGRSHYTDIVGVGSRTVIVVSEHGNKIGKATCHENDEFSIRTGIAIAFARAIGQEVPTVVERVKICSLSYGDKFMFNGGNYVYVAKHPTRRHMHIAVRMSGEVLCEFMSTTSIEKV